MSIKEPKRIECESTVLEQILERAVMSDDDRATMRAAIETLAFVTRQLEAKRTSLSRLRRLLFGARTEKLSNVLGDTNKSAPPAPEAPAPSGDGAAAAGSRPPRQGHGRNGGGAYRGAERILIAHAALHPGDPCPECRTGKLYDLRVPKQLLRITGAAPVTAKMYECQRLRCNTCGKVFTAQPPADVGAEKYDINTAVMIAVLKYGIGLPFFRLARLQKSVGVPLAPGTQWQVLHAHLAGPKAARDELVRLAAQADLLHNDDTTARVLELMPSKADRASSGHHTKPSARERTGVFTTGIVAITGSHRVALYFTGRQYAGENLADVLAHRDAARGPPLHMCDGLLSRNLPKDFETILCNCLAHARRGFVDVFDDFREQCRHVLETLRDVYRHDELARRQNLSAEQRLAWHQQHSAPLMTALEQWMQAQLDDKLIEPNSSLGGAIEYMQSHWQALTQFLRVPGAPLDNNLVERALKRAILHRKNALFFRTAHGADVGDIFLTLIRTAELCDANPIDYLRALMGNAKAVAACPSQWMPWNYQQALAVAA